MAPEARPTSRRVQRIAFLTPEFVTEAKSAGGVGNYVAKMVAALAARGFEPEVFVVSGQAGVIDHGGVRVERVPGERSLVARGLAAALRPLTGPGSDLLLHLLDARRLARALERRHAERPFEAVQSSNYRITGAWVAAREGRRHIVRLSTSRALYDRGYGGRSAALSSLAEWLDVRTQRRADAVYAPSRFLADYFRRVHGVPVTVARPPAELGGTPAPKGALPLPERYLVHFGTLGRRKGTETLARALPSAWARAPDLRMVWAGPIASDELAAYRSRWGAAAERVTVLGPLGKSQLYRVVADATAAVLPSTVDNLPNTVIESLLLGVPVIGTDGASIDELIEPGRSGTLVPIDDDAALAEALVAAWRGGDAFLPGGFVPPSVLTELETDTAVRRFVEIAAGDVASEGRRAT